MLDLGLPFCAHDEKHFEQYKIVADSLGEKPVKETSWELFNDPNKLRVYNKWEQKNDEYVREVSTYHIGMEREEIEKHIKNGMSDECAEAFAASLGKPRKSIQTQSTTPNIETMADDYRLAEVTITGVNRENFKIVKQTTPQVAAKTFLQMLFIFVSSMVPFLYRMDTRYSMIENIIDSINENQPDQSVKDLCEMLRVKVENLEMLGGGSETAGQTPDERSI